MSELQPRPQPALPVELVHRIITTVLVGSVHTLCTPHQLSDRVSTDPELAVLDDVSTDAGDLTWDINVFTTLSSVCWQFKDICTDIATKVFAFELDIAHVNEDDLQYARSWIYTY